MSTPVARPQKKPTHSGGDVKLLENVGSALVQLRQQLADAARQAKPSVSRFSYIDYEKNSKWADRQLPGYEHALDHTRTGFADAIQEVNRLCELLGIPATSGKVRCAYNSKIQSSAM